MKEKKLDFDKILEEAIECMKKEKEEKSDNYNYEMEKTELFGCDNEKCYTQEDVEEIVRCANKDAINEALDELKNKVINEFHNINWQYGEDIEPFSTTRYYEASYVEDIINGLFDERII